MFKKSMSRVAAFVLASALVVTSVGFDSAAASKKKIKSLTISTPTTVVVAAGKKLTVKATVKGTKLKKADKKVTFKVVKGKKAAKKAIKVSKKGKITVAKKAKKGLKVTVKVTTKKVAGKTKTKKFTVKVGTPVKTLTAAISDDTIVEKKTATITATVAPAKATVKTVKYSSSDKTIATVSADGVVTGVKAGKATITVKTKGNKKNGKVISQKIDVTILAATPVAATATYDAATGTTTYELPAKLADVDTMTIAFGKKKVKLSAVQVAKLAAESNKKFADVKKDFQAKTSYTVDGKAYTATTTNGVTTVKTAAGTDVTVEFVDATESAKVGYEGKTYEVKVTDGKLAVTPSDKSDISKNLVFTTVAK